MELEPSPDNFVPRVDRRATMPLPPPVRLLTVNDARLPAPAGLEPQLDAFYVGILGFEREADSEFPVYRAENFRLLFEILEPPLQRDDLRPLGCEVPALGEAEQRLIDGEIAYARQRGLLPGDECLVLPDPAGNWIEIFESRGVR